MVDETHRITLLGLRIDRDPIRANNGLDRARFLGRSGRLAGWAVFTLHQNGI